MQANFLQKTITLLALLLCFATAAVQAQTKIGAPGAPNANAVLELSSTNKGLLLSRVALVQTTNPAPLTAHVAGMFVYNTATANDVTPGIYYNDGTKWEQGNFATCEGFGTRTVSGSQPLPANTTTKVLFTAEDWDQGNVFTPATGTFTATQSGRYIITGSAFINSNNATTNAELISIHKNNVFQVYGSINIVPTGSGSGLVVTYIMNLAAGDIVDLRIINGVAAVDIVQASFSAVRVDCGAAGTGGGGLTSVTATAPLTGDGTVATPLAILNNAFWETDGNTGTSAATDFIGTTDAVAFITKTNNVERMRVTAAGNVGIGITPNPFAKLHVEGFEMQITNGVSQWALASTAGGSTLPSAAVGSFEVVDRINGLRRMVFASNGSIYMSGGMSDNSGNGALLSVVNGSGVGIGTITPARFLHVQGLARITGSVGTPTLLMGRDANGDIGNVTLGAGLSLTAGVLVSTGVGTVTASNGLTEVANDIQLGGTLTQTTTIANAGFNLNITGTGNVGIGTATPNNKLDLGTTLGTTTSDVAGKKLALFNNAAGTNFYGLGINNNVLQFHASSAATDEPGMILTNANRVGINDLSPASMLDITATTNTSGILLTADAIAGASVPLTINTTVGSNNSPVTIRMQSNETGNTGYTDFGRTANFGSIQSYTNGNAATNLLLNPNGGNVGIGLNAPATTAKLHLQGTVAAPLLLFDNYGSTAQIRFRVAGGTAAAPTAVTNGTSLGAAAFFGHDGTSFAGYNSIESYANENWTPTSRGNYILFSSTQNGTASPLERMRIDHDGRVIIGNLAPVPNPAITTISSVNNQYGAIFQNTANGSNTAGLQVLAGSNNAANIGAVMIQFLRGGDGVAIGAIQQNTVSTVAYITSSDRRLKENIKPSTHGLSTILRLQVRDYNYIGDETLTTGLIAQDAYKVVPSVVHVGGEDVKKNPWGMDYGKLTPYLVKAMQEQQAQIEALQAKVAALTTENTQLHTTSVSRAEHDELKAMVTQLLAQQRTDTTTTTTDKHKK